MIHEITWIDGLVLNVKTTLRNKSFGIQFDKSKIYN